MDIEAHDHPDNKSDGDGRFRQFWLKSLTLRKKHFFSSRLVACTAFVLVVLCTVQTVWLYNMYAGMRRYNNDPFDRHFPTTITRASPSIWDEARQSFIHNTRPVRIHSHNDEQRRIPLFEALGSGCISVEADVHLVDGNLLVAHSSGSLHQSDTLNDMYIGPLLRMLDNQNLNITNGSFRGMYNKESDQTLVLLVDHKTEGAAPVEELYELLQPLRERNYLTYWNGTDRIARPLTIVASGKTPFESILALDDSHRDIFWDAKLNLLPSVDDDFEVDPVLYKYNISNSYYASAPWEVATLYYWPESRTWPSAQAKDMEAPQIEQARSRGLLPRYWDTPKGPANMRDLMWRILRGLNVYVIDMDDMGAVRDFAPGWGKWDSTSLGH